MTLNESRADSEPHAVVTGGAGFIGSHLTDRLLEDGFRVTALDNYGSGRKENHAHLDDEERFEVIEHDIRDPFPEFEVVDQVYHFASRASPEDFETDGIEIAMTNSLGARRVFDLGVEHDATVVIASTSEIYGDPNVHPQGEEYTGDVNPRGPRAPYNEGKRFAEALSVAYHQTYDLDVRAARIFNTYGPRMRADDGRVIPNFVSQALEGDDLTVYGDGSQTRSFCYITDLVSGVRKLAETPGTEHEAVNLGNTHEITIRTLATTILDIIETSSNITYESRPQDDPDVRCPDISKATTQLDWEPTVSLEEGLGRTIDYFRTTYATPS